MFVFAEIVSANIVYVFFISGGIDLGHHILYMYMYIYIYICLPILMFLLEAHS